ncbi:MAG: hypothetical protein OXH82_02170 [Candidatus Dadabacteria bacterium]|nr:hypothetical protein [Candidatus Dadabacteria bacterium]MDE0662720.1 hypothetical protein [Candidatus Dadabacteria bacterium]
MRIPFPFWLIAPAVWIVIFITLAVLGSDALAADECGAATSQSTVVCSSQNYDQATEGNIFYQLPISKDTKTNYEFRLESGLNVVGTRSWNANVLPQGSGIPGATEEEDDHSRRGTKPYSHGGSKTPFAYYAAFSVDSGFDYDSDSGHHGDITVRSAADLTAKHPEDPRALTIPATTRARGISVYQTGESGDINVYKTGGNIVSVGPGVWAEIDSRQGGKNEGSFQDGEYDGDILIDISGDGSISTTAEDGEAIHAVNRGSGDVRIKARANSLDIMDPNIKTTGIDSSGILAEVGWREATDPAPLASPVNMDIHLSNFHILTEGGGRPARSWEGSRGLKLYHFTEGDMTVSASGSKIETRGHRGNGIYAIYFRHSSKQGGMIDIDLSDTSIETGNLFSNGVFAYHDSMGNIDIDVAGGTITTEEVDSSGIMGAHQGEGDIHIGIRQGATITTKSEGADGIYAAHKGQGGINISAQGGSTIETEGGIAYGIRAIHEGVGAEVILVKEDEALSPASHGPWNVYKSHYIVPEPQEDTTNIDIDINAQGSTITTKGYGAHGIHAHHNDGGEIKITAGTIDVSGPGSQGIRVADNASRDSNDPEPKDQDEDGYADQTVNVTGSIKSTDTGVFLAGGGRVVIGSGGRISKVTDSRIGILASGTGGGRMPSNLRVDMNLNGCTVEEVIGDNWIINDYGETTIAVNGVLLYDGSRSGDENQKAIPGVTVRSGVWNVSMKPEGANWNLQRKDPPKPDSLDEQPDSQFHEKGLNVSGRDFSKADFIVKHHQSDEPPSPGYAPSPGCVTSTTTGPGSGGGSGPGSGGGSGPPSPPTDMDDDNDDMMGPDDDMSDEGTQQPVTASDSDGGCNLSPHGDSTLGKLASNLAAIGLVFMFGLLLLSRGSRKASN